jgi:hypothetical protein
LIRAGCAECATQIELEAPESFDELALQTRGFIEIGVHPRAVEGPHVVDEGIEFAGVDAQRLQFAAEGLGLRAPLASLALELPRIECAAAIHPPACLIASHLLAARPLAALCLTALPAAFAWLSAGLLSFTPLPALLITAALWPAGLPSCTALPLLAEPLIHRLYATDEFTRTGESVCARVALGRTHRTCGLP